MSAISDGIGSDGLEQLDENLKKWFKEKWVRFGPDGKIRGACARGDDSEGKPKCLPQSKAHSIGKKGRKYAGAKKRREDPNADRSGKAKNVATKKKSNEDIQVNEKWSSKYKDSINCSNPKGFSQKAHCAGEKKNEDMNKNIPFNECPECRGPIVHESMMTEKQDACYHKVKSRYKVWPSAYASGALVQCRKKGASNWGTGGKKNENSVMKGLVDEAKAAQYVKPYNENGKQVGYVSSDGYHKKYWRLTDTAKAKAYQHAKLDPAQEVAEASAKFIVRSKDGVERGYNDPNGIAATNWKRSYQQKEKPFKPEKIKKPSLDQIWQKVEHAISNYFPDGDPTDYLNPYMERNGLNWDDITRAAKKNGYKDLWDYWNTLAQDIENDAYGDWLATDGKNVRTRGQFMEEELDEACWKGYHKEGNKKMFGKTYPNCVKNTNEEQIDEREMSPELKAAQQNLIAIRNKQKAVNVPSKKERTTKDRVEVDKPKPVSVLTKGSQDVAPDTMDAITAFLAKGGEIKKGRPGKAPPVGRNQASLHIGGGGKFRKKSDTPGLGAKYRGDKIVAVEDELDEACWDSHKQVGMKNKGGKQVPNCVPKESAIMKGIKLESK